MNDSLFVSLDRLLLEFVFQYEQDRSTKEDMIQRINKCFEDIKENKATICKIHESINATDEEIGHYYKHNNEIKDNCSKNLKIISSVVQGVRKSTLSYTIGIYTGINLLDDIWKPTCDVFHKHEDYMQDQLTVYQEAIEKDKQTSGEIALELAYEKFGALAFERKMYHGYICQYKDVLKQYQLKYSETPLSHEYYEKKREHEEIQNRVLACTEQLKTNETIFMEFLVPAPFPSLTKWTLHMVNLRCKTQDILKHANNFSKSSSELKKEVDQVEIEINYLNQHITRLYETKNFSETLEEKNKTIEKRKELKERIFEKDEHLLILNKTPQNSQLFLPYESQKLVRPIKMHSSEPRVTDKEKESSVKQSKLANIDLRKKENDTQVFNDSAVNNHLKCSHVTAIKSSQNVMQFRLLTPQKQSNCSQWFEKGDTDVECGDKGTRQLTDSSYPSQVVYAEQLVKPIENNNEKVEERAENFPQTPEVPLFLRTPEAVKTPESLEKLLFPKTPSFETNRTIMPEGQTQKESPALSFVMSYASRSPGLNLFDSSVFDSEALSDQFNEHYSARNLNPLSSQQEIGNLLEKPEEDAFTFSLPSDSSAHTFGTGKDDFSFPFSFEQEQNSTPSFSVKGFSSSSQNTTQFTFF